MCKKPYVSYTTAARSQPAQISKPPAVGPLGATTLMGAPISPDVLVERALLLSYRSSSRSMSWKPHTTFCKLFLIKSRGSGARPGWVTKHCALQMPLLRTRAHRHPRTLHADCCGNDGMEAIRNQRGPHSQASRALSGPQEERRRGNGGPPTG